MVTIRVVQEMCRPTVNLVISRNLARTVSKEAGAKVLLWCCLHQYYFFWIKITNLYSDSNGGSSLCYLLQNVAV